MENETDVIRNQMLETRTSLTEKLEALQETVVTAVQDTTESVTDTVQNVKEAVQDTVSNVSETVQDTVDTVKSTFDISKQVQEHPWACMGGAVALGYLGGSLLPSARTVAQAAGSAASSAAGAVSSNFSGSNVASSHFSSSGGVPSPSHGSYQSRGSNQSAGSSLLSGLTEALNPLIHELEGMAIGTLAGMVGHMALEQTPENLKSQVKEFIEKTNSTLGGKPIQWSNEGHSSTGQASTGQASTGQASHHQRF